MPLTNKQKAFCDEYIRNGGNATQAAVDAGYSKNTAAQIGAENLTKPYISAYIAERQNKIDSENICSLREIQEFRTRVLRGEEKDAFGMDASIADRAKVANDLEKALRIKEEHEEKKKAEELARKAKVYHIDLDMIPDAFHWVIRDIRKAGHREYVLKGGRASTKSSTIAMMILELLKNNTDIHALVCRKVANTIKDSVYAKIKWSINKQGLSDEFILRKSPFEIERKSTGQIIYFRGCDDKEKIRSINPEFGYIGVLWLEELDQFNGEEEIRDITESAIRGGEKAWIFKSFNPPKTKNNWANKWLLTPKENRLVHHSTYHDVPLEWLGKPFIEEAEHLKAVNPDAYDHEYGGEVNGNGGVVFTNIEIRKITDEEISHFDRIYQGVDWGWIDPYAFLRTHYSSAQEKIYLIDENYGSNLPNKTTAKWIIDKGYNDYRVTCDSEDPKSTNDYRDFGISAYNAIKGPGSVEYGFKWLQSRTLVIDPARTPNAFKEITEYEYKRDKEGNVISGYPDGNDHAISALRYAYESLFNKRGTSA